MTIIIIIMFFIIHVNIKLFLRHFKYLPELLIKDTGFVHINSTYHLSLNTLAFLLITVTHF